MRLLLASHSPWLGGAERCLLELARTLGPRHELHVTVPGPGPLEAPLRAAGAQVHRVPTRWWAFDPGGRPRLPPWGAPGMVAALRRIRPDAVVANTLVHPAPALAAAALGVPLVWWIHELGDGDHGFRFVLGAARTRRVVARLAGAVVCGSETVAASLPGPVRRVPYGVAVPAVSEPPPARTTGPYRLLVLGRVRPSKGQADAVGALARLRAPAVLELAGDGTPEDLAAIAGLARRLGVAGRVHVTGPAAAPLERVDAADVVLVCSRREAFGRVTVEAAKRGRPVVGAGSGGTAELIADGVCGRLYPPGDAAALARVLDALLAAPGERERLARAAWERALAEHDAAREAAAFEDVLAAVVAARGRRPVRGFAGPGRVRSGSA